MSADCAGWSSCGERRRAVQKGTNLTGVPSTRGFRVLGWLEVLVTLIEAYERQAYPIDLPTPIAAIQFRLEQQGKDHRALIGVIGQRTRVYEVMRGDRPLSLEHDSQFASPVRNPGGSTDPTTATKPYPQTCLR